MRISKSNKTSVTASVVSNTDISKMSTTELFNYIHDNMKESFAPESNWIRKFCDVSGISKDDADANYWHNTEIPNNPTANRKIIDYLKGVDACEDIKASTSTDKALKHIKAAIDILGKSGNKDAVTKDSIANLATVMFDIKASTVTATSKCKYSKKECIDAIQDQYGKNKKEAEEYYKSADAKTLEALVDGFKGNAKKAFLDD